MDTESWHQSAKQHILPEVRLFQRLPSLVLHWKTHIGRRELLAPRRDIPWESRLAGFV